MGSLDSIQPPIPPGLELVDLYSPRFQEFRAAYNSLPNPPVLATGQPNTWLLETTVQRNKRDDTTLDIIGPDGAVSCLGHIDMWLWNAENNTSAAVWPAHCKDAWGGIFLATTATDLSPRALDEVTNKFNAPGDARGKAVLDLCSKIADLLVIQFIPEDMFPNARRIHASAIIIVIDRLCSARQGLIPDLVLPDRRFFDLKVAPHTILVYDQTMAEVMNRMLASRDLLHNPPHFQAIPIRRNRRVTLISGTDVPIPVICAHCKVIGVTHAGPLGDAFEVLNRCASCSTTWYCSKQCQRENWCYGHKSSCVKVDSKLTKVPTICECGNKI